MKGHTSTHYAQELQEVKNKIIHMGALAERAIDQTMKALLNRESALASQVIKDDDQIDRLDTEIEERCVRILALRQPAARDLRFITTLIKINGHLERIGDMAVNIAKKTMVLNREPRLKPYIDLPRMASLAGMMVRESLDALIHEDINLANKVRHDDEIIDNLNEQIFRELLTFMMEDTKTIHASLLIMQVSKLLERISDHAKGMADMVIYMVTGENVRHMDTGDTEGEAEFDG